MKARNPVFGISSSMHAMNLDKKCLYTDEELIARFQDGDEQAYVELVYRFRDRLITFVYGYFKDIKRQRISFRILLSSSILKRILIRKSRNFPHGYTRSQVTLLNLNGAKFRGARSPSPKWGLKNVNLYFHR